MRLFIVIKLFTISFSSILYSQTLRPIHSIEIIKIAQQNGKDVGTVRFYINSDGTLEYPNTKNKDKVDIKTISQSLNAFIEKESKVIKVEGDNDNRPGIQEPYNGQHLFITIIFQDDFVKDKELKNKTCYRYRETKLHLSQKDFLFFKYLDDKDLKIIKDHLQ